MFTNSKNNITIDAVFTWVDGNDPNHIKKVQKYLDPAHHNNKKATNDRYNQVNEIEYAVKSIRKYASFVRNIYIVTDRQTPDFLNDAEIKKNLYPNVFIIDHTEIFKDYEEYLPTYNSMSIETMLYRIPGLSEHFLYLNDDFFIIKNTKPSDFFRDGKPILRGFWKDFENNRWYKLIWYKIKKKKNRVTNHSLNQIQGAKLTGFNKFYKFNHTPHPLRVSTFENFFKENPQAMIDNIKHRTRSLEQFVPQGLAYHLEIKNGTCYLKRFYNLVYFGDYKKTLNYYKIKFFIADLLPNILFINLQNLSGIEDKKLDFILNWLKNKFN